MLVGQVGIPMLLRKSRLAKIASASHRISPAVVLLIFSVIGFACSGGPVRPCERLSADAIFVGRVLETSPTSHVDGSDTWPGYSMRIEVEDSLKGKLGKEVRIETGSGGGDCGTPLPVGERFLILAFKNNDGKLWTGLDNTTQLLNDTASASLVESVRKSITVGQGSLFGRVSYDDPGHYDSQGHLVGFAAWQPVASMVIRATSANRTFATITAPDGQYEFSDLPNGTYTITPALEPGQTYDETFYTARFVKSVGDGSCAKADFGLRPTTRLKGKLLVPPGQQFALREADGVFLQKVAAVPVGLHKTTERSGFAATADADGSFDIWPIAPGDYYVGININVAPTPQSPFAPTYYPGVTDRAMAGVVHIKAGEITYVELPEPKPAQKRLIHIQAVGLDGKPLPKVRVQWEDLQHPGDAINSTVNVDLDSNGSGTMNVYTGINYHLHASYVGLYRTTLCAEPVTVPAGAEPAKVRFVMDRVDGPDERYKNSLAYGLCDIDVVDDAQKTAAIRALH
jgi:hypothetical protein